MKAVSKTHIGLRSQLSSGKGLRFEFKNKQSGDATNSGFVVEFNDDVYAYQNRCPHLGVELDWAPGIFFDEEQTYLVCSTHGAYFKPDTGICVSGPCIGQSLTTVAIADDDGELHILETGL